MGGAASRGRGDQGGAGQFKLQGQGLRKEREHAGPPGNTAQGRTERVPPDNRAPRDVAAAKPVGRTARPRDDSSPTRRAGEAKPWGTKPLSMQELAGAEVTPRAEQLTKHQQRTLEEQEDLSIEQQMAQRYKAFEAEQRRKEASAQGRHDAEAMRRKLEEQEDLSIEQQMAQQYKAFEAEQQRKLAATADKGQQRRKLEEQEDLSIEQQMAQQYRAFEKKKQAEEEAERQRKKLAAQEDASIEQQMAQQFRAFSKQREEEEAAAEADDLLNAFAPPPRPGGKGEISSKGKPASSHHNSVSSGKSRMSPGQSGGKASVRTSDRTEQGSRAGGLEDRKAQMQPAGKGKGKPEVEPDEQLATVFSPDSGDQAMRNEVSCIVRGRLYLTNFRGVDDIDTLERLNIKHVVCVNEQSNSHPEKFNYFNIDTLEDQEDHDATPHFEQVRKFTDEAICKGGGVVYHCAAGISRSATMMIAYLMATKRLSLFQAFQLTYTKRRVVWPNRSFMKQLIAYEKKLQEDGWLSGNTPSIALTTWDKWTASEECEEESHAKLMKQKSVKEKERYESLKGADSAQFQRYMDHMSRQEIGRRGHPRKQDHRP